MNFQQQVEKHMKRLQDAIELGDSSQAALSSSDPQERANALSQLVIVNRGLKELLKQHQLLVDSQDVTVVDGPTLHRLDYDAVVSIVAPVLSSQKRVKLDKDGLHVMQLDGFKYDQKRIVEADLRRIDVAEDACTHIRNLHALKNIRLSAKAITSLEDLRGHPSLAELFISDGNRIQDFSILSSLPKLTTLGVFKSAIDDSKLQTIFMVSSLKSLDLTTNPVTSLQGIDQLSGLKHLSIWRCPVVDLKPLVDLKSLETLSMAETAVTDFSPLLRVGSLRKLHIKKEDLVDRKSSSWWGSPSKTAKVIDQLRRKGVGIIMQT
jgi:hypothetical protein